MATCMTCSLLAPCKRALTRLFRIRAFRFRTLRKAAARMSPARRRRRPRRRSFRSVRTVFWPLIPHSSRPTPATSLESHTSRRDVAAAAAEEVIPEAVPVVPAPVPSPETPAYAKMVARLRSRTSTSSSTGVGEEEKEEACQSFESCLMEILMEDGGKVRDLQDVEELLQSWERLKSPVFVDLVCRFYVELCKDVFGVEDANADRDELASVLSTPAAA
ncbi:transcription repressor OFP17 [Brachypodium distachyon]|uniref:OVATE domain-containing protein n=1 Tax=Brachypodium distachyon TaxID=15368 RepID=I1HKK5_BRADI|nr:transcription repressor OFP17 [Brachypodium distachyon]KQK06873.1 hypothetical protein BRADI_2g30830v3 [Brachypodium distachyon]PNT71541.1 hypothetical protein BRADI_2g30830v3 [Brachypodium distachyon]|eukprot:XP_010233285.1 transcription repressor OFP17 [Brachypodium distachyon]